MIEATGLAASSSAFVAGQALLARRSVPHDTLRSPGSARAVLGGGLHATAAALFGLGIGLHTRSTAGAVSTIFGAPNRSCRGSVPRSRNPCPTSSRSTGSPRPTRASSPPARSQAPQPVGRPRRDSRVRHRLPDRRLRYVPESGRVASPEVVNGAAGSWGNWAFRGWQGAASGLTRGSRPRPGSEHGSVAPGRAWG